MTIRERIVDASNRFVAAGLPPQDPEKCELGGAASLDDESAVDLWVAFEHIVGDEAYAEKIRSTGLEVNSLGGYGGSALLNADGSPTGTQITYVRF